MPVSTETILTVSVSVATNTISLMSSSLRHHFPPDVYIASVRLGRNGETLLTYFRSSIAHRHFRSQLLVTIAILLRVVLVVQETTKEGNPYDEPLVRHLEEAALLVHSEL